MSWAIGITLRPGKSYMEITGRLVNSTENDNSMLYWSNVSTLVDDNYQIIFPQSTEFVTFHCKNWFAHWPVTREPFNGIDEYADGIDASWWKNHFMSNSMFVHDLKEDFIAGYEGPIPGATEAECGNYREQDLEGARVAAQKMIPILADWTVDKLVYQK